MTTIDAATKRYQLAMDELTAAGAALHQLQPNVPREVAVVQQMVATHFGLRLEELWSNRRPDRIATPRMVAMTILRRCFNMRGTDLATYFHRDCTTVYAATQAIADRYATDPKFGYEVDRLADECIHAVNKIQ